MSVELQQQIESLNANSKSLVAQLDACKQMYNEHSNTILQLRTNINIMNQQLAQNNQDITNYKDQITKLIAQVNELTPKPTEVKNAPDKK